LAGLVAVAMLALGAVAVLTLPAVASAATCTDSWTGPVEGSWETAEDWSLGTVPTSSDVACVGSKATVKLLSGSFGVGVLQVEGTLVLGGTLEVVSASEASSVATLTLTGALKGAGTVDVSGSMSVANAGMSGSGSTVIQSGASVTIGTGGTFLDLEGRTLVNEGTVTIAGEGSITESEGAKIVNSGTLTTSSETGGGGVFKSGSGSGKLVNSGLLEKTAGTGRTEIGVEFENLGTLNAKTGSIRLSEDKGVWGSGSVLEGTIELLSLGGKFTSGNFVAPNATLKLVEGTLVVNSESPSKIGAVEMTGGTLGGAGTVEISKSLSSEVGIMEGSGTTVLLHGATATLGVSNDSFELKDRKFVNEGTVTLETGLFYLANAAEFINENTFKVSSEDYSPQVRIREGNPRIQNYGLMEKVKGEGKTLVEPSTESLGSIVSVTGKLEFVTPVGTLAPTLFGERNPSDPGQRRCNGGDPVNCATGNFYETQTDLAVGGRGVGLELARTYNARAGAEGVSGAFGHGWSNSFSDHLVVEQAKVMLYHGNGSAVPFIEGKGETFTGPAWTQDSLSGSASAGYSLVLANQVKYQFEGSTGRLQSVTDRNGNQTTLGYDKAGQLETIADPAGRKITLAYNEEGLVKSAKDPLGNTVKYTYEGGALASVTLPGEAKARWQYHYDTSHRMTSMIDGRSGETTNEYDASNRVTSQTDPAGHKLKFEYEAFHTKVTNNGTGSVTDEWFTSNGEPTRITRGFGTASASTETLSYDVAGDLLSTTDGNEHTTEYTYDGHANMLSMVDPNKNETKWTYDQTHDILTMTTPKGETTKILRDAHGNAETVSRPAPGSTTQTTTYHYNANGQVTSMVDPLKHTWSYEYNNQGDRTAAIDPEGDKRTFGYDEDSRETSTVSPAGNVKGAEAGQYTTKIERDAQGRPATVTDPLGHTAKHTYDGNGNLETFTDGEGHTTTYTYNGDNQLTKVKAPNGATTETEYDGAGRETSHTDANKHTTTYVRNILGEITEIKDPLGRVTKEEYDVAGNLKTVIDAAKRTTKYTYDPANRLTEISYSDGKTPAVKYEYDADGDRTKMTDGTGKTSYTYDILDRLVQSTDGHGDITGYEYNLGGQQIKLTYPNGTPVTRAYDNAGRLQSVTDPSKNTTTFAYDPNSNPTTIIFPKGTGEQDKTIYNHADQVMKITMTGSGLKVLASLAYTRNNNGQVKTTTTTGLPGSESAGYGYDANNRLTSGAGTSYEYDPANNPTKIGATTYTYDAASQLEAGGGTTYGYDQLGERTSSTPKAIQTTTFGYDQAGNLTQVKQSKIGLNDTYAYNGDGLRASQAKGKTTTHLTWDTHAGLPLILSDETNSYVYGPGSIPIEQIQSKGVILYLHHDQQGSTRLLTSATGAIEATTTYDAYGNTTASKGTATTPLGYDAQYTNTDTGLIYLRARAYDPATAQFLTTDPLVRLTRAPYAYAADNPVNYGDPTGQDLLPFPIEACLDPEVTPVCALGAGAVVAGTIIFGHEAAENFALSVEREVNGEATVETSESECAAEFPTYDNPNRNPAQDKKLTPDDIRKLEEAGFDPHRLKYERSRSDLYKDREGNVYEKPMGGSGPGEPIGINLNHP